MAEVTSSGDTTACNCNLKDKTRTERDCYILSFDGGGCKGVIELTLLKRVFDYLTILQQRPETANWVFVKGSCDVHSIIEKLGNAGADRVIPIKNYQHDKGIFQKSEKESSFIVSFKTFNDKLKVMEGKIADMYVKDFVSFWMNYWFIIGNSDRQKIEKRLRFSNKKRFENLGIRNIQIADLEENQILVMTNFDTDSSIENRIAAMSEIRGEETYLSTSDFINLLYPTDIFDIIVGTSTGSLISFGLVGGNQCRDETFGERQPMSFEQILEMCRKYLKIIFSRNWFYKKLGKLALSFCPYPTENLQRILETQFGKDTVLSQIPSDKCIAAAVARKISKWEDELVLFDSVSEGVKYTSVTSALLASSNAPVYFRTPVKIGNDTYVDGGVGGNCPLKQVFPLAKKTI